MDESRKDFRSAQAGLKVTLYYEPELIPGIGASLFDGDGRQIAFAARVPLERVHAATKLEDGGVWFGDAFFALADEAEVEAVLAFVASLQPAQEAA